MSADMSSFTVACAFSGFSFTVLYVVTKRRDSWAGRLCIHFRMQRRAHEGVTVRALDTSPPQKVCAGGKSQKETPSSWHLSMYCHISHMWLNLG